MRYGAEILQDNTYLQVMQPVFDLGLGIDVDIYRSLTLKVITACSKSSRVVAVKGI
jgi:hypothetical protein